MLHRGGLYKSLRILSILSVIHLSTFTFISGNQISHHVIPSSLHITHIPNRYSRPQAHLNLVQSASKGHHLMHLFQILISNLFPFSRMFEGILVTIKFRLLFLVKSSMNEQLSDFCANKLFDKNRVQNELNYIRHEHVKKIITSIKLITIKDPRGVLNYKLQICRQN